MSFYRIKNITKYSLVIVLFCTNVGCAGNKPLSAKMDEQQFYNSNKSVLIAKIVKEQASLFSLLGKDSKHPAKFVISRYDDNYDNKNKKLFYKLYSKSFLFDDTLKGNVFLVEPGSYIIEDISWTDGAEEHRLNKPGIKNGLVIYGAFTLKPNQVGYLGELVIDKSGYRFKSLHKTKTLEEDKNIKDALATEFGKEFSDKLEDINFIKPGTKVLNIG